MFKTGTTLRYPIRNAQGILLLGQGALVNDRLRAILEVRGISLVIQVSLKVLQGGQIDLEIPVNKPLFRLGRRPDCDLQLASHDVSGHHCWIINQKFDILIRDLDSSNGTFLNGKRLTRETELTDGDQIRVGHFIFKTQIFAAMAADSSASEKALKVWVLEETSPSRKATSQYCRTEPDIDLDNLIPLQ
jgi:pSer/pThr/pTyr-binding forkhead associated (FHA) protein